MEAPHQPVSETSLAAGHETRDVSVRGVLLLGSGLMVVALIVHLLLAWLFDQMEARARRRDPPVSPLAEEAGKIRGPVLELKVNARQFEAADRERLTHYGWVQREQKVIHIPIERAMQLLVERGLPEPAGPVKSTSNEASETQ